jgi:hypothetical protein
MKKWVCWGVGFSVTNDPGEHCLVLTH